MQCAHRMAVFLHGSLKVVQVMKYKLATPMTGLDIGLKREWLIGQQLNTITGDDGELHGRQPHILATHAHLIFHETL